MKVKNWICMVKKHFPDKLIYLWRVSTPQINLWENFCYDFRVKEIPETHPKPLEEELDDKTKQTQNIPPIFFLAKKYRRYIRIKRELK